MNLDHYRAVVGLLSGLPWTFYDKGQVPDKPTFPYYVLYVSTPDEDVTKLCGTTDTGTFSFRVTSVGLTVEAVLTVTDAVRDRVLDVRPDVAGRSCNPIRKVSGRPVQVDRDVTLPDSDRHPMYAVDDFEFLSVPA